MSESAPTPTPTDVFETLVCLNLLTHLAVYAGSSEMLSRQVDQVFSTSVLWVDAQTVGVHQDRRDHSGADLTFVSPSHPA